MFLQTNPNNTTRIRQQWGTVIVLLIASVAWSISTRSARKKGTSSTSPSESISTLKSYGDNRAAVARETLQLILNRSASFSSDVAFVPPCGPAKRVMESTSSLLVATALTKADNVTLGQHNLWQYFDGLFAVQSLGFIPRYSYPVGGDALPNTAFTSQYIPSTSIPNWPLFRTRDASVVSPCGHNETQCWVGSGRISAIPFHGTILLELVFQLEKRQHGDTQPKHRDSLTQNDIHHLQSYWDRIFEHHAFLHDVVMRGCNNNRTTIPCYNILHPWESLLEASSSPSWQQALTPTLERMSTSSWSLPFHVPDSLRRSYSFNETIYKAMIYLNECLTNTSNTDASATDNRRYPYEYQEDASRREDHLLKECQFAMLDVGYATALAQADQDLETVALWLSRQEGLLGTPTSSTWSTKTERLHEWNVQNDHVYHLLWHQGAGTYQSRYSVPAANTTEKLYPVMRYIDSTSSNNLMIFWKDWSNEFDKPITTTGTHYDDSLDEQRQMQRIEDMAAQLLSHKGSNSFDCSDSYPLWSAGCESDPLPGNVIDPRWNYFVGLGLARNKEHFAVFQRYLMNATIQLICGDNADDIDVNQSCAENLNYFAESYATHASKDGLGLDECGRTSTSTASILYHLLLDDFDFHSETPIPPIRNSWVIILITAELIFAFTVGVSCVALSLNIVRRENRMDPDEFTDTQQDGGNYGPLLQDIRDGLTTSEIATEDTTEQDIE